MRANKLEAFLKILDLRKAESALMARQARARASKLKDFESKLQEFQEEYEKMWLTMAQEGGAVDDLMVSYSFIARLADTVKSQQSEVAAAAYSAAQAAKRAATDGQRVNTLKKYINAQSMARRHALEKVEDRHANETSCYVSRIRR